MHIYSREHSDIQRASKIVLVNNTNYTKASLYISELFRCRMRVNTDTLRLLNVCR